MKPNELNQFITKTAQAINNLEKLAVPLLAVRAKKAAELNPDDVCLVQAANVLDKMSVNGKSFITRTEFNKLYDSLYTRNSKFAEFFKDELGSRELPKNSIMQRSASDEGDFMESAFKNTSDPILSNALSQIFDKDGKYKIYSEEVAKKAQESCLKELNSIGAPPKFVKVFAGQNDLIICQATYETPKGKSEVLVPVEIIENNALLPNMFLSQAGFVDLKKSEIQDHIVRTAGKSYRVDGEAILQALSNVKNGTKVAVSDVEIAAMKLSASKETPSSYAHDGIVYQSIDEEIQPVQDIQYKLDPEVESFAKSLASPKGIANHLFGAKNIQAANNLISRKLASWGFKNAQVAVDDATDNSVVYAVSLAGTAGFRVPVKVHQGNVQEPTIALATGKVYEFSKDGIKQIYSSSERDSRALAKASPSYELKTSDLIKQIKEAMDDNNYTKAEDALNVLASRDDQTAYQTGFAVYMNSLNMKNPLAKQAEKLEKKAEEMPLLINYKVFL